jgi:UrcA family protein
MFKTFALLAAATLSAGVAHAEPATKRVAVGDLNLMSPAGRDTFDARVRVAAKAVCGVAAPLELQQSRQVASCKRAAIADARQQAGIATGVVEVAAR